MKLIIVSILSLSVMFPLIASAEKVGGGDLTFTPKDARPVVFSHEKHVSDKGLKCTGCHYQIFEMQKGASSTMDMSKLKKGDMCGKCHNGQKSFDVKDPKNCVKCHK